VVSSVHIFLKDKTGSAMLSRLLIVLFSRERISGQPKERRKSAGDGEALSGT